jgi:uncharacterized protein YdhG (YjbR/CyaY superfamily)
MAKTDAAQVREYLASLPADARRALQKLRSTIRSVAPGATESISYGIPAFKLAGQRLVYCAAWKEHTSLYPLTAAMRRSCASELKAHVTSKGTVRFPLEEPIPVAMVKRLVKARIAEIREKAK